MASLNDLLYDIRRIAEHREQLSKKRIAAIYKTLTKEINSFLAEQYAEYSDADGRLHIAELDAARKKAWFLNEIAKNVDGISPKVEKEIMSLVDDTYSTCYSGMIKALKAADSVKKFEALAKTLKVNPKTLKQAVDNNISKLTLPRVMEKNRAEIIYQIQQELNIGLINGDRYDQMAKRISQRVGVSQSKAYNIVRTETHRNVEAGFLDSAVSYTEEFAEQGLIGTLTWHTRKDERVRPQQRRKTKKGWKTYWSKNGANHMKMEGVAVRAGDLFDLGNGVGAKAPGLSGVAAHDCQCRCTTEYEILTAEEFAEKTGQSVEEVRKKYNLNGLWKEGV